jgi:hypothetical protein
MILPVHRMIATMLVLTAIGALAAGCGSSGGSSVNSSTPIAGASITKARAVAYAQAVNPGADGSFGLRLTTSVIGRNLRGGEIQTRVYIDMFGFVSGPAEISLTAFGVSRPVPSTTEQHLLPLLFSRTREHKL